jgi:hypothetical protein
MFNFIEEEDLSNISVDVITNWVKLDIFRERLVRFPYSDFCSYSPPRGPNKNLFCSALAEYFTKENGSTYLDYRCEGCTKLERGERVGKIGRGAIILEPDSETAKAFARMAENNRLRNTKALPSTEKPFVEEDSSTGNLTPETKVSYSPFDLSDIVTSKMELPHELVDDGDVIIGYNFYGYDELKTEPVTRIKIALDEETKTRLQEGASLSATLKSSSKEQDVVLTVAEPSEVKFSSSKDVPVEENSLSTVLQDVTLTKPLASAKETKSSYWLSVENYINNLTFSPNIARCSYSPKTGKYKGLICGNPLLCKEESFWEFHCPTCPLDNTGSNLIFEKLLSGYNKSQGEASSSLKRDTQNSSKDAIVQSPKMEACPRHFIEDTIARFRNNNTQEILTVKEIITRPIAPDEKDLTGLNVLENLSIKNILGDNWYIWSETGTTFLVKFVEESFTTLIYGEFDKTIGALTNITREAILGLVPITDLTTLSEYNFEVGNMSEVLELLKS